MRDELGAARSHAARAQRLLDEARRQLTVFRTGPPWPLRRELAEVMAEDTGRVGGVTDVDGGGQ